MAKIPGPACLELDSGFRGLREFCEMEMSSQFVRFVKMFCLAGTNSLRPIEGVHAKKYIFSAPRFFTSTWPRYKHGYSSLMSW